MGREIKLSATRISMFLECKLKYWLNYHDNIPKMTNPAFKLGLVCHRVLEKAGRIWIEHGKFTEEDRKMLNAFYNDISVNEGVDDLEIHKEGLELVNRRLDDFMIGEKIVSLEDRFGMSDDNQVMTKDGVLLIGAMDKVVELDEYSLMVIDYKTSNTMPTGDQLKNDIQLSIYDLVASIKWPKYERIILCLDLLKGEPMTTYRTPEERAEFSDYLTALHNAMTKLKKTDAKPSLNIFCPWCDYKDYCRTYKKAYEKTNYSFEAAEKYRDADLLNEWMKMRDTKKIVEGRERELAMLIMERMKRQGSRIHNESEEVYVRQNSRTAFDIKTVYELVPERDFLKMVKLNKRAVEKYITDKPRIKARIVEGSQSTFTSPFLATKKFNEEEDKGNGKK